MLCLCLWREKVTCWGKGSGCDCGCGRRKGSACPKGKGCAWHCETQTENRCRMLSVFLKGVRWMMKKENVG